MALLQIIWRISRKAERLFQAAATLLEFLESGIRGFYSELKSNVGFDRYGPCGRAEGRSHEQRGGGCFLPQSFDGYGRTCK